MLNLDFDKVKGGKREAGRQKMSESPQEAIEQTMHRGVEDGLYEAAFLFTEDGLLLAEVKGEGEEARELLAEIAVRLGEIRHTLSQSDDSGSLHEVVLESRHFRKIVFRIIRAFGQNTILAVMIPPQRSYRAYTNRLEKIILRASFE